MAIDYTKIGWDTTKYVNPTNMNQMDDGIKAACDGVDTLDATAVKKSNAGVQTIATTSGNTALALIGGAQNSYLEFRNNSSSLGSFGVLNGGAPVFNNGTDNRIFTNADGYTLQLAAGIAITANSTTPADLNTFTDSGTYYLASNNGNYVAHKPVTSSSRFTLIVSRIGNNANCLRQIYMPYSNRQFYVRNTSDGGTNWSDWTYLLSVENLKNIVAASTDFADFQTNVAAL